MVFLYVRIVQYCINNNCNAGCLGGAKNYPLASTHDEIVPNTFQNKHFCCKNAQNESNQVGRCIKLSACPKNVKESSDSLTG